MVGGYRRNATECSFCCLSVESHKRGLSGFRCLSIACPNVFHRAPDGLVAEALTHQGEVHIASDKVGSQGVFESVRVTFLGW